MSLQFTKFTPTTHEEEAIIRAARRDDEPSPIKKNEKPSIAPQLCSAIMREIVRKPG